MPQRKRSCTHKSTPKLFRCTGFGTCNMVFTRSEHLARHERKHTGEKPYKCIVPGCGRMFSRFDNMMQHTQTHDKNKKRLQRTSETKEYNANTDYQKCVDANLNTFESAHGSHPNIEWQNHHQRKSIPELAMVTSSEHSMLSNRILPPLRRATYSDSPSGYTNYQANHPYSLPQSPIKDYYNPVNPHLHLHPPPPPPPSLSSTTVFRPYQSIDISSFNIPGSRYSWPTFRGARIHHSATDEQSNGYSPSFGYRRRSSTSTASTDTSVLTSGSQNHPSDYPPSISSNSVQIRRRISIDDLRTPIEDLQSIHLDQKINKKPCKFSEEPTVDITPDEYEALEGFSKFHSKNIVSDGGADDIPVCVAQENTTFASQVCALRQRVMSLKESFQRPVRNTGNNSL